MAIKPTIYKFNITLSDLNRDYYDSVSLTVALHPSETLERMMARVMAFCCQAEDDLIFTKGLSETEEPDLWKKTPDDQIQLWIDVGEPSFERIKKASRLSPRTIIYTFNSKSDVWWAQSESKLSQLNASVIRFDWENIEAFAKLIRRTTNMSLTITGDSAFVATEDGECEVNWETLKA